MKPEDKDKEMCPVRKGVHHFRIKTGRCYACRKIVYKGLYRYNFRTGKLVIK